LLSFFVIMTMIHGEYIVLSGEVVAHMRHPQLQEKGGSYAPGLVGKTMRGPRPFIPSLVWQRRRTRILLAERITPMGLSKTIWTNPTEFLKNQQPENPVLFFAPSAVQAAARKFLDGFPGLVTYAVKSNPGEEVIENLIAAGVKGFDCASPFEIDLIRVGLGHGFNHVFRLGLPVVSGVAHAEIHLVLLGRVNGLRAKRGEGACRTECDRTKGLEFRHACLH
jgi:hypothetical protein